MWAYWPHLTRTQCWLLGHAPYRNTESASHVEEPIGSGLWHYVIQESVHYCRVCGKELSHETDPYPYPGRVTFPGRDRRTSGWTRLGGEVREHLWALLGSGWGNAIGHASGRKL